MSRKKLQRHREFLSIPRCVETQVDWLDLFGNTNPITLEIACGRGEYTNKFSSIFPLRNFVGVDIKGERLWQGAMNSSQLGLGNTGFLRTPIDQLELHFPPHSIQEIWIIHPDPQPNKPKKRLTHQKFLDKYSLLLNEGGVLHLKTDNTELFEWSKESLATHWNITNTTDDLHNSKLLQNHHGIITNFEAKALQKGLKIHYLTAIQK
jgi:tRNA (guanine-N7-)-methyltransferase